MRVIISAGGTGGHIYPALAIINKIKELEPNSEFLYIGTHNRMEKDIVPLYNIPFKSIKIYGFDRKNILNNFRTLYCFIDSYNKCKKIIKEFNPDIVIGVGGYVTGPVLKAANKLGYKTFIHEQNSVAGKANIYLSKFVDKIGISFESSKSYFPSDKVVLTGNPCGENALTTGIESKDKYGLDNNKKLVLFVMGSLGASKVNDVLIDTMPKFMGKDYEILYVTGKNDYDKISKLKFPSNVKVVPYIENMTRIMKNTDIIVSRSGASTLSEIMALNIPSILIPSPYVPNNHQYKNAMDLVNHNAAEIVEESNLTSDILVTMIDNLINNVDKKNEFKKNLKTLNIPDSSTRIYNVLKEIIGRN